MRASALRKLCAPRTSQSPDGAILHVFLKLETPSAYVRFGIAKAITHQALMEEGAGARLLADDRVLNRVLAELRKAPERLRVAQPGRRREPSDEWRLNEDGKLSMAEQNATLLTDHNLEPKQLYGVEMTTEQVYTLNLLMLLNQGTNSSWHVD